MNKISTLATHYISEENNFGFSAKEYSKFKFGSSKIGQLYGDELFEKLINQKNREISSYKKIYVFTSPYDFIPTATNTMFESFFNKLFKHLTSKCVVEKRKIHRNTTYTNDYGSLSKDQRMKLISNDSFNLKNDFEGNELLIFLDDIKITGSHEFVVKKTLKKNRITNDVFFMYHAILNNKNIDPIFENYLNYSYVKGVNEILKIYNKSDFVLNTRFTKYILQLSDDDINYFLSCIDTDGIEAIIIASKGNKYNNIPEYYNNLKNIIKLQNNSMKTSHINSF